jgi:hypothetical protein
MHVSRKRVNTRDSDKLQSAESSTKHRRGNLNSEINGKYWQRESSRLKLGLGSRLHDGRREGPVAPSTSSLIVRPVFHVGLLIIFGGHQAEQPFRALQRLSVVLNPASPVKQAYEVEEPESPPHHVPSHPRSLPAPQSPPARSEQDLIPRGSANARWDFTPSWDALRIGARILAQALTFPFKFARYLVNVAPETSRQAGQIESAKREQEALEEQQLIEQWHRERRDREESSFADPEDLTQLRMEGNKRAQKQKDSAMPGSWSSTGPSGQPPTKPPVDNNAVLLQQFQAMSESQMASLRLELGGKKADDNDPNVRKAALDTEKQTLQAKMAAIEAENDLIQKASGGDP